MRQVKTRDKAKAKNAPYPLNEFPPTIIQGFCKRIAHLLAVGHADMGGDTFGRIYADCFGAKALGKPLGVADITWHDCAWSAKTVKNKAPHEAKTVRLISGRNSPVYSAGITDYAHDIQATGQSVLDIYNKRIGIAQQEHDHLRLVVCLRDMTNLRFTMFERPISQVAVNDYEWMKNARGNLEGYKGDKHVFTWQPHGSQFTIKEEVPASATRFQLKQRPNVLPMDAVLQLSGFTLDWVEFRSR